MSTTAYLMRKFINTEFGDNIDPKARAIAAMADGELGDLRNPLNPQNKKDSVQLDSALNGITVDVLPLSTHNFSKPIDELRIRINSFRDQETHLDQEKEKLKKQRDEFFKAALSKGASAEIKPLQDIKSETEKLKQQREALHKHTVAEDIKKLCVEIRPSLPSLTEKAVAALSPTFIGPDKVEPDKSAAKTSNVR